MAKIDEAPTNIKKSKNGQKIVIKQLFWTCWIHKTRMQVLGWVVERGATWGGRQGGQKWSKSGSNVGDQKK